MLSPDVIMSTPTDITSSSDVIISSPRHYAIRPRALPIIHLIRVVLQEPLFHITYVFVIVYSTTRGHTIMKIYTLFILKKHTLGRIFWMIPVWACTLPTFNSCAKCVRAKYTTVCQIAPQCPGHGSKDDLKIERCFIRRLGGLLMCLAYLLMLSMCFYNQVCVRSTCAGIKRLYCNCG